MLEIIELLCMGTGEIVLFIVILGKHKPSWKNDKDTIGWAAFEELSLWIGMAFWLAVGYLAVVVQRSLQV